MPIQLEPNEILAREIRRTLALLRNLTASIAAAYSTALHPSEPARSGNRGDREEKVVNHRWPEAAPITRWPRPHPSFARTGSFSGSGGSMAGHLQNQCLRHRARFSVVLCFEFLNCDLNGLGRFRRFHRTDSSDSSMSDLSSSRKLTGAGPPSLSMSALGCSHQLRTGCRNHLRKSRSPLRA